LHVNLESTYQNQFDNFVSCHIPNLQLIFDKTRTFGTSCEKREVEEEEEEEDDDESK